MILKRLFIADSILKRYFGEGGKVVIPDSVTSIGEPAFGGCKKLIIHTPAGSCAENHAKEKQINFIAE